ncbi:MAG: hypothetical protein V2I67_09170 [Thermoanaerobaculales bacterium]|nr:hypothetical protein [Thermoanaerobaculales bacterium]
MITFIQCVRKKPDVSIQDFRRSWKTYQVKATELAKAVNAVGLTFSTILAVDENLQVMLFRGTSQPYDGLVELRVANAPRMMEKLEQEPAKSIWQELQALQKEFIDLERSSFFFAAQEVALRR